MYFLLDITNIESVILGIDDTVSTFVNNTLSSAGLFTIRSLTVDSSNTSMGEAWTHTDVLDWLGHLQTGYHLFLSQVADSLQIYSSFIVSTNNESSIWGVGTQANPILLLEHLELAFGGLSMSTDLLLNIGGALVPTLLDGFGSSSFSTPFMAVFTIINYLAIAAFMSLLLFTITGLSSKSGGSTDTEHVISSLSTEAEKELFSLDDAVYLFGLMLILAGAYFGSISVSAMFQQYDTSLFLLSVPAIFLTLVGIPLNLLYDFGLFFLLYLRGVATTKVVLFELAYDYIGVVAFFTRLLVQFVRLILMFVVYFMMHETVMVYQVSSGAVPFSGSTYGDVFSSNWGGSGIGYFLITTLPAQIGYWLYETVHTLFIVTAQVAAFMTIALWLFLLFYSFFVFEKHENHFKALRAQRKLASY